MEKMSPDASSTRAYTDLQGLNALRAMARSDSPQAANAVAREFEAMFIQTMLKSMREAALTENPFESEQMRMYQDLFDKQIAMDLASRGELGMTDFIAKQLGENKTTHGDSLPTTQGVSSVVPNASHPGVPRPAQIQDESHSLLRTDAEEDIRSPEEFIEVMRPHAEKAAREMGVNPKVLLAQAALETGWGKKVIRHPDGSSGYNLFGIKADARWDGDRISVGSLEYENGIAKRKVSAFRAYDSYAESFKDYVQFLRDNPRYADAFRHVRDSEGFVESLQAAGYATDPNYAGKIKDILQSEFLRDVRLAGAEGMINRG
jgi:flagellar protein FlgJ